MQGFDPTGPRSFLPGKPKSLPNSYLPLTSSLLCLATTIDTGPASDYPFLEAESGSSSCRFGGCAARSSLFVPTKILYLGDALAPCDEYAFLVARGAVGDSRNGSRVR